MNGYSLVPAGGGIIKVFGAGKSPRNAGVPIISDESQIPLGDQVISFLFKLRFADPLELQTVLGQYLSPPNPYTSTLPLPKSGSILVTENSAVIRSLVNIINQVDIPPAEVVSEFIKLERADASKVVDMLKDVFEKGQNPAGGSPSAPGVRNVRPAVAAVPQQPIPFESDLGTLTALSEDSVVVGKIKLAADVRTNRIHVITRPVNMSFVKRLIAEFDANVDFAKPVTRPLRYISAADVLPVIVQALTEPGGNENGNGANGAVPNPNGQPQNQQQRNRFNSNSASTSSDFGSSNSSGNGSQNFSEELSTQAVDTTPKAVTIGNAKIIADQRANTIIVLGNREVVVKVQKLLNELDVSAPQVALSTVIGALSLTNGEQFGVDFFERFKKFDQVPHDSTGGIGGVSSNAGSSLDALRSFTSFATQAAGSGGASVFVNAGFGLSAIVKALNSTGRFRTISRPTVFTSNNKKAIIASGQEIPVPVSTISSGVGNINNGLAQQSNIQFKKVALQLEVVPLINSEKEVSLDILQKVDSLGTPTLIDGNSIPTVNTRYIKTTVSAANGSTIMLGGLIQDVQSRGTSGIPVLSRIPLVGALFRNTQRDKSREELIVLMRPEVTLTKLDLQRLRQKTSDKTHFGPEIEEDDAPPSQLPAGEDKQLPAPDLPIGGEK